MRPVFDIQIIHQQTFLTCFIENLTNFYLVSHLFVQLKRSLSTSTSFGVVQAYLSEFLFKLFMLWYQKNVEIKLLFATFVIFHGHMGSFIKSKIKKKMCKNLNLIEICQLYHQLQS